jgi:GT2 family glycosyltransferase
VPQNHLAGALRRPTSFRIAMIRSSVQGIPFPAMDPPCRSGRRRTARSGRARDGLDPGARSAARRPISRRARRLHARALAPSSRVLDSIAIGPPDPLRGYPAPAEALLARMDLSVILVSYRSREPLLACLRALRTDATAAGVRLETVVVDNDSRDGTPATLAAEFPEVRVIENRENVGYARAVNQGLGATAAPLALVLNPDCEVHAGALRALLDHAAAHPRTGLAGPRILNPDGTLEYSARSFPGPLTFLFNRYSLLTRLFPGNRFSRRYLLTDWDHASVREVDWVSGACMLARREAVGQVGGMDEAFFMFNEDVDWCRRMRSADWAVTYEPAAVVTHHIGASRARVATRVIWGRHLGMIHYFHKHHPTNPLLSLLADALILLRALLMIAANTLRPR